MRSFTLKERIGTRRWWPRKRSSTRGFLFAVRGPILAGFVQIDSVASQIFLKSSDWASLCISRQ